MIYAVPRGQYFPISLKLKSFRRLGRPFDGSPAVSITLDSFPFLRAFPECAVRDVYLIQRLQSRANAHARELWSAAWAIHVRLDFCPRNVPSGHLPGNP